LGGPTRRLAGIPNSIILQEKRGPMTSTAIHGKVMKTEAEWRSELSPEQFYVTRKAGTERAFSGPHWNEHRAGLYRCVACGTPLFRSETKFDSGTGWPSFYQPVADGAVEEIVDSTHGMVRTEVRCARCESHLGHVFNDGPQPTGLRYCMNGTALRLEADDRPGS
jgi:peptide-methionine (R)-S-oxide reductase